MAITWEVKITVLDYNQKHVSVTGARTDSADPSNPKIYTVVLAHIGTVAQRTAVLDALWAMHLADTALAAKVTAFAPTVANLEVAAKTNLETREV